MTYKIVVGRLDNNKRIDVDSDATILEALESAGFTKSDNEVIQDIEGNEYESDDLVESGTAYFLVQRVKSGQ